MADLSQSIFLQALGWATLNSLWQAGLLWIIFTALVHLFRLSPQTRHHLAAAGVVTTFVLFCYNILSFDTSSGGFLHMPQNFYLTIQSFLLPASVAYLLLLAVPVVRFVSNWKYVQRIRSSHLQKAAVQYRVYVRRMAMQLNIERHVQVFVSALVKSPVTVGFLKPVILLPVAAVNHLSVAQIESILLHELSHVRRHDYLVNMVLNMIHALLYFNPFVKLFMQQVDEEREFSCDRLVIEFGYDRAAYCTALLSLEKASKAPALALGMAGNHNLLSRIETIAGMNKKKSLGRPQLFSVFAALISVVALNSTLIINDSARGVQLDVATASAINPLHLIDNGLRNHRAEQPLPAVLSASVAATDAGQAPPVKKHCIKVEAPEPAVVQLMPPLAAKSNPHVVPVAFDEVEGRLSKDQKEQVSDVVSVTKDVLTTLKWQEVENAMADALDAEEKQLVKAQYMMELQSVNWDNLEKNLKANFDKIDWTSLSAELESARNAIEIEKLENTCITLKKELARAMKQVKHAKCADAQAFPDVSLDALTNAQAEINRQLEVIRSVKNKKVIKL